MKKKILSVALAAALIAIMVSGSLAYFTAEDKVDNTFTIGSVLIDIYENGEATPDAAKALGKLTPIVNIDNPAADESYMQKAIQVKNTGANDAYIRTHIAIPTALADYLQLVFSEPLTGWTLVGQSNATVGQEAMPYTVLTFDHTAAVTPGNFTALLLQGVYLKPNVDLEANADGDLVFILRDSNGDKIATSGFVAHTKNTDGTYTSATVNILVASEAIQAQGFTSGATNALNSGFGANTNPWH